MAIVLVLSHQCDEKNKRTNNLEELHFTVDRFPLRGLRKTFQLLLVFGDVVVCHFAFPFLFDPGQWGCSTHGFTLNGILKEVRNSLASALGASMLDVDGVLDLLQPAPR